MQKLASQYQLSTVNFGHAGNHNIHVNLLVNPDNAYEMQRAHRRLEEVFSGVLSLQSTLHGKHGICMAKRPFMQGGIDVTTMALMNSLKLTFDPLNILNPGELSP